VQQEGQRVLIMRQAGGDVALTIDELFGQRSSNWTSRSRPARWPKGATATSSIAPSMPTATTGACSRSRCRVPLNSGKPRPEAGHRPLH
jgi:hypothetical protein